jgi:multimeric flavodoxin WrbA
LKILVLNSSPRKADRSNSTQLANRFAAAAHKGGAEITTFNLNDLTYRGCQACDRCRVGKGTPCTLRDDLTPVLNAVYDTDILVLSTPVYFGDVTAAMKAFIDRSRAFLKPDFKTNPVPGQLAPGKQVVWVLVQAQDDAAAYEDIHPRYSYFFKYFNFEQDHLLRAIGVRELDEIKTQPGYLQEADELAVKLVG